MGKIDENLDLQGQLAALRKTMGEMVIGQEEAIDVVVSSLERYQAGLHDNKRPIGTFLFLGPTGTGKSYTCETFAELTQPTSNFIRLDCAEFSQDHEVAKLFGSPPGYIAHGEGSLLTRKLDAIENPEQGFVLLLDEIEKAHPRFFDAWLSVMDIGYMTDSKGKKLDFTKSIIFLTSNIGANHYSDAKEMGFRPDRPSTYAVLGRVQADVKKTFRPEFINRLSGTVYFDPLTKAQQELIFNRLIADLNSRLARRYVHLELGEKIIEKIFTTGFSKEYGAREIKRTIIKNLEHPLAKRLIDHTIKEDSLIMVNLNDKDQFYIQRLGDYPVLVEEATLIA